MLTLFVAAAAVGTVWRLGYWPFSRSFQYLPSYGQLCQNKATQSRDGVSGVIPPRPTL